MRMALDTSLREAYMILTRRDSHAQDNPLLLLTPGFSDILHAFPTKSTVLSARGCGADARVVLDAVVLRVVPDCHNRLLCELTLERAWKNDAEGLQLR